MKQTDKLWKEEGLVTFHLAEMHCQQVGRMYSLAPSLQSVKLVKRYDSGLYQTFMLGFEKRPQSTGQG